MPKECEEKINKNDNTYSNKPKNDYINLEYSFSISNILEITHKESMLRFSFIFFCSPTEDPDFHIWLTQDPRFLFYINDMTTLYWIICFLFPHYGK